MDAESLVHSMSVDLLRHNFLPIDKIWPFQIASIFSSFFYNAYLLYG